MRSVSVKVQGLRGKDFKILNIGGNDVLVSNKLVNFLDMKGPGTLTWEPNATIVCIDARDAVRDVSTWNCSKCAEMFYMQMGHKPNRCPQCGAMEATDGQEV